jgi:hypothetical protein
MKDTEIIIEKRDYTQLPLEVKTIILNYSKALAVACLFLAQHSIGGTQRYWIKYFSDIAAREASLLTEAEINAKLKILSEEYHDTFTHN